MADDTKATESPTTGRLPYEKHADELGTPGWLVAAAAMKAGWASGREVTLKQYEKAVSDAQGEVIGNGN